jgi:alpha-mannosidase
VVPHTHWDREWYLPFEHFRLHLVRTVDEVVDTLEDDPAFRCFTLDGQAVLLEDYLELRPEREERLRALIEAGRIAIGPWYTLPDEYLVGQESLVRNLLLGRQVCEGFGRPMAIGYLPDCFGHVAQLPQILRGFDLPSFVFWRGLGDEAAQLGSAFRWRGPDGSEVLAVRQLGGYGNADRLGNGDPAAAAERIEQLFGRFGERYELVGLADFLLCNGTDHRPIQAGLPRLLADCTRRLPGTSYRIATIEEYVEAVRRRARKLEIVEGELCGGGDIAVLRGVNSARMWLKQANEEVERELFAAEVLASLALLRGTAYPAAELRRAWRELLRNHPHDSICGCSIDEVHRDMAQRFDTARALAGLVQRKSLAALAGYGLPWSHAEPAREAVSLVNVLSWPRRRAVELELPPQLARARRLVAYTDNDDQLAVQVDGRGAGRRALVALDVPGLGSRRITLRRGRAESASASARAASDRAVENDFYRVETAANGTLVIADRSSGARLRGFHLLEDRGDRGDEYNFCALEGERLWTSRRERASVRVVRRGPVVAELEVVLRPRLPAQLGAERRTRVGRTVACPVTTRVRLVAGVDRIEFSTTVDNRAKDHRLRVLIPAPGASGGVRVEGHFAVLDRPPQPVWNGRWSEPPQTTHHTLGLVAAGDLALFTRGLPEYEALPREDGGLDLALTLLRCVGWLSRGDLSNRFHHAGPALETPGAQCIGTHTLEYAISLREDSDDAALVRAAHDYRFGLAVGPAGIELSDALGLDGDGFCVSALKQAEDGDGLIARVYNPSAERAAVVVRGPARVERCRLDETPVGSARSRVPLRPYEVATLRLRPS